MRELFGEWIVSVSFLWFLFKGKEGWPFGGIELYILAESKG